MGQVKSLLPDGSGEGLCGGDPRSEGNRLFLLSL